MWLDTQFLPQPWDVLVTIAVGQWATAIVIALACAALPPEVRGRAVFWGTAGAVGLRAILLVFASFLMGIPYVKLVAGAYLLFLGISNQGSRFPFLESIGDKFRNTGFVSIPNLRKFVQMSDEEINQQLIGDELLAWFAGN